MTVDERVRYRFPPLERRGVVAGWRGGQIAAVAVSLVMAVGSVRSGGSPGAVAMAVGWVAAGVASAFVPVRGRTVEQWCPLVVRWLVGGRGRGRRSITGGPEDGFVAVGAAAGAGSGLVRPGPPPGHRAGRPGRGVFRGLEVVELPMADAPPVGLVLDRPARTATVVLVVRGRGFALLGPDGQDGRVAAWARVLGGLAREGSGVHRIQWLESSLPGGGHGVRAWARDRMALGADHPARRSYEALLAESAPEITSHRVLVALTVHTGRSARTVRVAGGGLAGLGAVVERETAALVRGLEGAEVVVDGVLGPRALARSVARSMRPAAGPSTLDPSGAGSFELDGARAVGQPWPHAVGPTWDAVAVDGTWHTTYWIAEWPRVDVAPDFLGPLLLAPVRRTVALVMAPVGPLRAAREVARARTAEIADHELRRRGGFVVTARQRRERLGVESRDVELADGHVQYRFSGYVTVTADDRDGLVAARSVVEQAAGQAQLELRLLYGEQDRSFLCTLPLGRGVG